MRIVSLLASGTELCCALGAGDDLVGRSHECDRPAWVTVLPALSRPTFDVSGSSAEIDALVRGKLAAGEPLYQIDETALAELAPDVLITQTHCQVCAVSPETPGSAPRWERKQAVALATGSLAGVLQGWANVATAIGRPHEGAEMVAEARARIAEWESSTARLHRPRTLVLEWIEPPFALGNWGPELVRLAGGDSLLGRLGGHSTAIGWDEIHAADADVIIVAPCGFDLERTAAEMSELQSDPRWCDLRAVKSGCGFIADGNLHFNRSGPHILDTVDLLAEILHPDVFEPRREGIGWRRLAPPVT